MGVEHQKDIDDGTKIFKLTHAASKLGILSRSKTKKINMDDTQISMARSQKAIHDLKHGKPEESVFYNGRLCKITVNERVKEEING